MDDTTGKFHSYVDNDAQEAHEELLSQFDANLVKIKRLPDPNCRLCHGSGSKKAASGPRKYIPCECVKRDN